MNEMALNGGNFSLADAKKQLKELKNEIVTLGAKRMSANAMEGDEITKRQSQLKEEAEALEKKIRENNFHKNDTTATQPTSKKTTTPPTIDSEEKSSKPTKPSSWAEEAADREESAKTAENLKVLLPEEEKQKKTQGPSLLATQHSAPIPSKEESAPPLRTVTSKGFVDDYADFDQDPYRAPADAVKDEESANPNAEKLKDNLFNFGDTDNKGLSIYQKMTQTTAGKNLTSFGVGFGIGAVLKVSGLTYAGSIFAGAMAVKTAWKETTSIFKKYMEGKVTKEDDTNENVTKYPSGKDVFKTAVKGVAMVAVPTTLAASQISATFLGGPLLSAATAGAVMAVYAPTVALYKAHVETKEDKSKSFVKTFGSNLMTTASAFAGAALGSQMFWAPDTFASTTDTTDISVTDNAVADNVETATNTETALATTSDSTEMTATTATEKDVDTSNGATDNIPPSGDEQPSSAEERQTAAAATQSTNTEFTTLDKTATTASTELETAQTKQILAEYGEAPKEQSAPVQVTETNNAETATALPSETVADTYQEPATNESNVKAVLHDQGNLGFIAQGKYAELSEGQIADAFSVFRQYAIGQCVDSNGNLNMTLFRQFIEGGHFTGMIEGKVQANGHENLASTIENMFRTGSNTLTSELPVEAEQIVNQEFDSLLANNATPIDLQGKAMHHFNPTTNQIVTTDGPLTPANPTPTTAPDNSNPYKNGPSEPTKYAAGHSMAKVTVGDMFSNTIASVRNFAHNATDFIMTHAHQNTNMHVRAA